MSGRFGEASALVRHGDRYVGEIQPGWDILGNANGGYLMAIFGRAALQDSDRPDIVSLSASFLSPGQAGPVDASVERIKEGKRFITSRVQLRSPEKVVLDGSVIVGDLSSPEGPELVTASPPDLPAPSDCVRTEPNELFPPPFMGQIEQRLHPDDTFDSPKGAPRVRGWFRLLDGEPLDTLAVVLATDNFPPTVFRTDLAVGWVPTVQMTVHVRNRPTTEWLAIDTHSRFIQGGMFEVDANVFDQNGLLIAQSRQLQLVARA